MICIPIWFLTVSKLNHCLMVSTTSCVIADGWCRWGESCPCTPHVTWFCTFKFIYQDQPVKPLSRNLWMTATQIKNANAPTTEHNQNWVLEWTVLCTPGLNKRANLSAIRRNRPLTWSFGKLKPMQRLPPDEVIRVLFFSASLRTLSGQCNSWLELHWTQAELSLSLMQLPLAWP